MSMETKDNENLGLKSIIVKYLLHWRLFVAVFIVSIIPAVLYLVLYPRTYEMMARIQVQPEDEMGGSFGLGEAAGLMKSFGLGGGAVQGINIDDELAVLTSSDLVSRAVLNLGLNVTYSRPFSFFKMYNSSPLRLEVDSVTNKLLDETVVFVVSVSKGQTKVKAESESRDAESFTFSQLPAVIRFGGGIYVLSVVDPNAVAADIKMNIEVQPASWAAEELIDDKLLIEEVSKNAYVIELSYQDHEKGRGKDLLNTLIAEYNKSAYQIRKVRGDGTIRFLDDRIKSVMTELSDIELKIEGYKTKNKLTLLESDVLFYTEQMKELQVKILEIEMQSYVVSMMNDFVRDPANKYKIVPQALSAMEGEKGGSALSMYNETLIERDRIISNSSVDNPLVATLNAQIDKLRDGVYQSIANAQKSFRMAIDDLKGKEQLLLDKMGNVPAQEREYVDYKRQQEIYQGVYLILLQKREDTAMKIGDLKDKGRVVDAAFVKSRPVGPRKLYAVIGMLIFTLVVSVGYIFGKEQITSLYHAFKGASSGK